MGNLCSCIRGDSKKPSKKHVKRELYSTSTVSSLSTLDGILRRYAVSTSQGQRPRSSWVKKGIYPVEALEESPTHKDRGDGERLVNARVVQVVPLRCDSTPCGDPIQDISDEDTVYDICDEDAVDICNEDTVDICNEAAGPDILNDAGDICNEAAVRNIANENAEDIWKEDTAENIANEDIVYNITNEDTEQHTSEKEDAAKEPFILENDLFLESISDDEDL
ncbi:uncharacterized protein LOC126929713 isoform X1 [Macaca thibetana thibetana]|uniref:uncharacterized protein LOC126929713 isoform X1 n=1 Tax=Macaca thibetana thibetana TaxID=257877 RepID=UPI0021BCB20B|nr:uncharacterized protein LOC126929713 isoform X1 [Macaca thibetana thibetana]